MSGRVDKNYQPVPWGDSIRQNVKAIDRENLSKGFRVCSTFAEFVLAIFECFPPLDYFGIGMKIEQFKGLCSTGRGYLNVFAISKQLILTKKEEVEGEARKSWKEQVTQISLTVVNIFEIANFSDKMFVHYFDQASRKIPVLDISIISCVIKISSTVKGVFSIWIGVCENQRIQKTTSDVKEKLEDWLQEGNHLNYNQAKDEFLEKLNEVLPPDCRTEEIEMYTEFLDTGMGHQFLKEHKVESYVIEVEELVKNRDRHTFVIASEVQKIAWTAFSIISAIYGSYLLFLMYPSVKAFFALIQLAGNFFDLKQGVDVKIVKAAMRY